MKIISPRADTSAHSLHTSRSASITGLVSHAVTIPFLLLVTALVLISGCATTSDRAAKTLASTVATVDVAMQSYANLVALDVISTRDQVQVKKLYEDYQAAETVAEVALLAAIKTGDTNSLVNFNAALNAAQMPLLQFLARFTTSPPSTINSQPSTSR